VASAGDNVLALAAAGAEVVAADLSAAQLACLEIRRAAFRVLDHDELLRFLGAAPRGRGGVERTEARERVATYRRLRAQLPGSAVRFWDSRPGIVARGVLRAGRFERYLDAFRRWVLPLIHSPREVRALLRPRPDAARRRFYDEHWDNRRWRLLFRLFFSRALLGRLGRDPEFLRYVDGSVGDRLLARVADALRTLPPEDNPFLERIVTGGFRRSHPAYLRRDRFEAVRDGLDRIVPVSGAVDRVAEADPGDGFDGFNLSDVFEYAEEDAFRGIYRRLLGAARPGARLVYWNLLVPRTCPEELRGRIVACGDLSRALHRTDRAFFYTNLVVEEVL